MSGTVDYRATVSGARRQLYEVVGVAKDVTEDLVVNKKHRAIYFPLRPADYARPSLRGVTLTLRAKPGVNAIAAVRRGISAMDSTITPFNARSMTEQITQFMSMLKAALDLRSDRHVRPEPGRGRAGGRDRLLRDPARS